MEGLVKTYFNKKTFSLPSPHVSKTLPCALFRAFYLSGFSLKICISLWSKMFSSGSQVLYFGLHPFHFTRYSMLPFFIRFLFILSAAKTISPRLFCSIFRLFSSTIACQITRIINARVDFEYF